MSDASDIADKLEQLFVKAAIRVLKMVNRQGMTTFKAYEREKAKINDALESLNREYIARARL